MNNLTLSVQQRMPRISSKTAAVKMSLQTNIFNVIIYFRIKTTICSKLEILIRASIEVTTVYTNG